MYEVALSPTNCSLLCCDTVHSGKWIPNLGGYTACIHLQLDGQC